MFIVTNLLKLPSFLDTFVKLDHQEHTFHARNSQISTPCLSTRQAGTHCLCPGNFLLEEFLPTHRWVSFNWFFYLLQSYQGCQFWVVTNFPMLGSYFQKLNKKWPRQSCGLFGALFAKLCHFGWYGSGIYQIGEQGTCYIWPPSSIASSELEKHKFLGQVPTALKLLAFPSRRCCAAY